MDLRAERANHRMGRAPYHVALRACHKVGGNVRAGNLHGGDVLSLLHFIFNFFHLQIQEKRGVPFFLCIFLIFLTLCDCECGCVLAILIGELERHGVSAEEERILLGQEDLRRVLVCMEFDEREALDGAEVLAWRGVLGM